MKKGARLAAMEVLVHWEETMSSLDEIIAKENDEFSGADPRERNLFFALTNGVVRWKGYLDWLLDEFSRHPVTRMKPFVRQALRVGLFQLLYMDRIPASAAVNETVEILKKKGHPAWLTGFVNGILRNIERQRHSLPDPGNITDNFSGLAVRFSHPAWLVERWVTRYGLASTTTLLERNNCLPPLTLRVNSSKTSRTHLKELLAKAGLEVTEGAFAPGALVIFNHSGPISSLPGYWEGLFQVQDEGAQLVTLLLFPAPGGRYLDACAGVGGKTSHLAELAGEGGHVDAIEPHGGRRGLLHENLDRLGQSHRVTVMAGELENIMPSLGKYDGVLVDAPCSGLGVIRRHPDIRWNRSPYDFSRYQAIQLKLLSAAASLVAPNKTLVYATCSTEPEENEEVALSFITSHPEFRLMDAGHLLPKVCRSLVDNKGFFCTTPNQGDLDGFFAAGFIRTSQQRN